MAMPALPCIFITIAMVGLLPVQRESHLGDALQSFIYYTPKVLLLLTGIVIVMGTLASISGFVAHAAAGRWLVCQASLRCMICTSGRSRRYSHGSPRI